MSPTPQPELFPEPETPQFDMAEFASGVARNARPGYDPAEQRQRNIVELRGEDLAGEQTGVPPLSAGESTEEPEQPEDQRVSPDSIRATRASLGADSRGEDRGPIKPDLVGNYARSREGIGGQ